MLRGRSRHPFEQMLPGSYFRGMSLGSRLLFPKLLPGARRLHAPRAFGMLEVALVASGTTRDLNSGREREGGKLFPS